MPVDYDETQLDGGGQNGDDGGGQDDPDDRGSEDSWIYEVRVCGVCFGHRAFTEVHRTVVHRLRSNLARPHCCFHRSRLFLGTEWIWPTVARMNPRTGMARTVKESRNRPPHCRVDLINSNLHEYNTNVAISLSVAVHVLPCRGSLYTSQVS